MNPAPCFPLVFGEKSSRRPSLFQCSFLHSISVIWAFLLLNWPKILFGLLHNMLWENLNELFGQPNSSCSQNSLSLFAYLVLSLNSHCLDVPFHWALFTEGTLRFAFIPHENHKEISKWNFPKGFQTPI